MQAIRKICSVLLYDTTERYRPDTFAEKRFGSVGAQHCGTLLGPMLLSPLFTATSATSQKRAILSRVTPLFSSRPSHSFHTFLALERISPVFIKTSEKQPGWGIHHPSVLPLPTPYSLPTPDVPLRSGAHWRKIYSGCRTHSERCCAYELPSLKKETSPPHSVSKQWSGQEARNLLRARKAPRV